jgi:hypothetical protein
MTGCPPPPYCPPQVPPVVFNYAAWIARYPEFVNVDQGYAQLCFDEATLYCANVLCIVCTVSALTALLNMLTAHIVRLYAAQVNGQSDTESSTSTPNPGTVGRISNATEGSVSVTIDMPTLPQAAAWYAQTQYGMSFWAATAIYRTARYVPGNPMQPAFGPGSAAPYAWPYGLGIGNGRW